MTNFQPGVEESVKTHYDVIVVGAGMGGIYAVHRFRKDGLSVLGIEAAPEVGGVWYHNAYPGARVDVESYDYCYFFDQDLYSDWTWTERYAAQPEILRYLNYAADRLQVKPSILFNTWVNGSQWDPDTHRYVVTTDTGKTFTARYLVMATGNLSKPRKPDFAGIDEFKGEWHQSAHWPRTPVQIAGRRVAVIGTGSSGVQAATAIAKEASELYVFQRTANYSVPAHNREADQERHRRYSSKTETIWKELTESGGGIILPPVLGKAGDYTEEQQQQLLEERWAFGGQALLGLFADQGTDQAVNDIVSNFVRGKVRQMVKDPETAEKLMPTSYPIGVRRLCIDTGFYDIFNQENVTLVDVNADPITRITPTGIQAGDNHYEVDLIVFALGFEAFTGALDNANIRNEHGQQPSDLWKRGPRTYLGLMTAGFPNLFTLTGPLSPSVLANMNAANVQHVDFIADMISHMNERGLTRVEPTEEGQQAWMDHAASLAKPLLRLAHDNYMVHVNKDDGSRVFVPYSGGFNKYVDQCNEVVAAGYRGFAFDAVRDEAGELTEPVASAHAQ
ncbi:flavin-containing monooxygenase [Arthrobacter sp. EPSL27]|uniref:flavin-containing monooxygenase n=1 Tax=Arthrobacter sp. EPSL27 TaxID=1745378 RepID=UPI000A5AC85A|nr:NAD(P)/FAD-dependent oxidoreductase [Arthrobacter sp. EPSL27]